MRFVVDSQENLTDEQMKGFATMVEKYGHFCFLPGDTQIDTLDVLSLPPLKAREEEEKSPATRLRNSLYILWKQGGEKGSSELYYRTQMEKIIIAVQEKLT